MHTALAALSVQAGEEVIVPPLTMSSPALAVLHNRSIPVFADESVQRLGDVERLKGVFSGINIKLMKCTGMHEAWKMRQLAKSLGMKVMMGCMTETSCAISAAAQLYAGMDFADLDGALLIANDCFMGATLENGKIIASDKPGIGVEPSKELTFGR